MRFARSSFGGVLVQVMIVAGLLAGIAPIIIKSGLLKSQFTVDERQDLVIEDTMMRASNILSDSVTCKASMDSGFSSVGSISPGLLDDQVNVTLLNIGTSGFNAQGEARLNFLFSKEQKEGSKITAKSIRRFLDVKTFIKNDTGETFCLSYITSGAFTSYQYFCEYFGGSWNPSNSQCSFTNLSDEFKENFAFPYGCQVLGSNLTGSASSGWSCDGVNISGPLDSPHFNENQINLSGSGPGLRTNFQNTSCSGIQVGSRINADSSLSCKNVSCPQPSTSTYIPTSVSAASIQCQCQRDSIVEKPSLACGDSDPQSCSDYMANDGCGSGRTCLIRAGRTCPSQHACINRSCICQPSCACLSTNPLGCSDGCGGTCDPICTPSCACASSTPVGQTCSDGCGGSCNGTQTTPDPPECTPSCACASSTPVGQTCSDGCEGVCNGTLSSPDPDPPSQPQCSPSCSCASSLNANQTCTDGCGGSCSGRRCDYLDSYTRVGSSCRFRNYASLTSTPGACSSYSDSITSPPTCKELSSSSCNGSTGPSFVNAANGTSCPGGTCQNGQCVSTRDCVINPPAIGWRGSTASCAHRFTSPITIPHGKTNFYLLHNGGGFVNGSIVYSCNNGVKTKIGSTCARVSGPPIPIN